MEDCKYRLPCGRCEKYDRECDALKNNTSKECEHDWEATSFEMTNYDLVLNYTCRKCKATKKVLAASLNADWLNDS